MNIITQNPFRVLGLTGNASERELQKQIGIIKRYAEIGKSKTFDYDFKFMGDFSRTIDDIQQASSKIEQAHKKLHYSLFWFIKDSPFDEIALSNLTDQNTEKAIEIWQKTLKEEVSNKNYASYLNLSTLYIALSAVNEHLDIQRLQKGIDLKGILIHSDSIKEFSKLVTGNGFATDQTVISQKFVEEIIELLKPYLNQSNGISTNELISLFSSYPINIQKYLSGKFTEAPISNIENKIEKTLSKRNNKARNAEEYGEELYKSTKTDLTLLKKLLGKNNVQFQMIANKLANEIMQCSIDFFNELKDENGELDLGDNALRIANYAKSVGATGQTKNRIDEGIQTLRNIKFQDCYRAINVLKALNDAFSKLEEENRYKSRYEKKIIDKEKALNVLRIELTNRLIKRIAKSDNQELISDFYQSLIRVMSKFTNSTFLNSLKNVFIESLPKNNQLKINIEKEEERKRREKKRNRITREINSLESHLKSTRREIYNELEIRALKNELASIKEWKFLRSSETKENQINKQQRRINRIVDLGEVEKKNDISRLEKQLLVNRRELNGISQK